MAKESGLFQRLRSESTSAMLSEEVKADIWKEFGQTSALLVGDSSGFTQISKKHGILHSLSLIARMRGLVLPIFAENDGEGVRGEADNIYAIFDTVDDAVSAAQEAHEALQAHNKSLPEAEHFAICIGIGYGKVLNAGHEGAFGDEMNLASKLGEDTADPNEILLTSSAFGKLKSGREGFDKKSIQVSDVEIDYFRRLVEGVSQVA
jgi:adenylate cyclase